LKKLDFDYEDGFGCQNLYGNIWHEGGTWQSRGEYDGSEWWEYFELPEVPKECRNDQQTFIMKKYQLPEFYCKSCASLIEKEELKSLACPICECHFHYVKTDDYDLSTGDKIDIMVAFLKTASIEDVESVYNELFMCGSKESLQDITSKTPVGGRFSWEGVEYSVELGRCIECDFKDKSLCDHASCMPSQRFDKKLVIFKRQ
jgi:hypothetical protein